MEQTKLTVRVPKDLLEGAKRHANDHNTTLTRLVSAYLWQLSTQDDLPAGVPIVQRLSGTLSPDASAEDSHRYLEKKHGA